MAGNELPKDLVRARCRFETWRRLRKGGSRIPPPLWRLAVGLARDHGVSGLINLFGIESPGLTSSHAIADHVGDQARE